MGRVVVISLNEAEQLTHNRIEQTVNGVTRRQEEKITKKNCNIQVQNEQLCDEAGDQNNLFHTTANLYLYR